jgi:Protein of unknown function (DUF2938)
MSANSRTQRVHESAVARALSLLAQSALTRAGATAVMDLAAEVVRRTTGTEPLDYRSLGRWVGRLPKGRIRYDNIRSVEPLAQERELGLLAHYCIGMGFAVVLAAARPAWVRHPTPASAHDHRTRDHSCSVVHHAARLRNGDCRVQDTRPCRGAATKPPYPRDLWVRSLYERNRLRPPASQARLVGARCWTTTLAPTRSDVTCGSTVNEIRLAPERRRIQPVNAPVL